MKRYKASCILVNINPGWYSTNTLDIMVEMEYAALLVFIVPEVLEQLMIASCKHPLQVNQGGTAGPQGIEVHCVSEQPWIARCKHCQDVQLTGRHMVLQGRP
jgi:hypothetical protein